MLRVSSLKEEEGGSNTILGVFQLRISLERYSAAFLSS